jgi:hypothetical protein
MPRSDPEKNHLSKYQTNTIYRIIGSSEIPVIDFKLTWSVDRGIPLWIRPRTFAVIRHSTTNSLFGIKKIRKGKYYSRYQVQAGKEEGRLFRRVWGSSQPYQAWEDVLGEVQKWIIKVEKVAKEIEQYENTPDLWGELSRSKDFFTSKDQQGSGNAPFTEAEQTSISAQIEQIKDYIKTKHELTSEQLSHIEARLDEVEQASRRIGRKDWLLSFNGALFSLILTDLITPQTAQQIIMMTFHGLSHLFGIGGPPHLLTNG